MIYKSLLDSLLSLSFPWDKIFHHHELDPSKPFSDEFVASLIQMQMMNELGEETTEARNLVDMVHAWKLAVVRLGLEDGSDNELRIIYRQARQTGDLGTTASSGELTKTEESVVLGTCSFPYDGRWMEATFMRSLEFWLGSRDLEGVSIEECWKCGSCEYQEGCEWREERARALTGARKRRGG